MNIHLNQAIFFNYLNIFQNIIYRNIYIMLSAYPVWNELFT